MSILHPPSATVFPFQIGEVYFFGIRFCDFAFGFAQNDKGGFSEDEDLYLRIVKYIQCKRLTSDFVDL